MPPTRHCRHCRHRRRSTGRGSPWRPSPLTWMLPLCVTSTTMPSRPAPPFPPTATPAAPKMPAAKAPVLPPLPPLPPTDWASMPCASAPLVVMFGVVDHLHRLGIGIDAAIATAAAGAADANRGKGTAGDSKAAITTGSAYRLRKRGRSTRSLSVLRRRCCLQRPCWHCRPRRLRHRRLQRGRRRRRKNPPEPPPPPID